MSPNFRLISFFLLLLISCGGSKSDINDPLLSNNNNSTTNTGNKTNTTSTTPSQSYVFNNELVWADEFDQDSFSGNPAVSPDKWNIETVAPDNGSWYNGELQYYTDKHDNIKVEDGILKITAKREDFQGKLYTSARINTQDKFEFMYGRVEMRAKLPNWEGMWPAFTVINIDFGAVTSDSNSLIFWE